MKINTNRVVLNITQDQAIELNKYFLQHGGVISMLKLQQRLEKTIAKNQAIDLLRKSGAEPTKEEVKKAVLEALK